MAGLLVAITSEFSDDVNKKRQWTACDLIRTRRALPFLRLSFRLATQRRSQVSEQLIAVLAGGADDCRRNTNTLVFRLR